MSTAARRVPCVVKAACSATRQLELVRYRKIRDSAAGGQLLVVEAEVAVVAAVAVGLGQPAWRGLYSEGASVQAKQQGRLWLPAWHGDAPAAKNAGRAACQKIGALGGHDGFGRSAHGVGNAAECAAAIQDPHRPARKQRDGRHIHAAIVIDMGNPAGQPLGEARRPPLLVRSPGAGARLTGEELDLRLRIAIASATSRHILMSPTGMIVTVCVSTGFKTHC